MLFSRILTALVLLPIALALIFLLPQDYFALAILLVCLISAWEWAKLASLHHLVGRSLWLLLVAGLLLWGVYLSPPFPVSSLLWLGVGWWAIALVLTLTYPASASLWRHSVWLRLGFGLCALLPFFAAILQLREIKLDEFSNLSDGVLLLYVMLLVWGADTGAYIAGKTLGRHKLIPHISPGKTWEGLFGGLITASLVAFCYTAIVPFGWSFAQLCASIIIIVLASVFGDLTESMLKRSVGMKDSGNILPGHGGMLDRVDSLLAAIPLFTFWLLILH